ncbi:MAG: endopeptidase La [Ruminococcaceae bacterium]|nr:endopeptidase La [Oscillospiraceae bacterium]
MPSYIEKAEQITLPVAVLRDTVAFPSIPINFEITDDASSAALKKASIGNALLFLVTACESLSASANPREDQLYRVGTVAKIKQMLRTPEGNTRVIAEGFTRAVVTEFHKTGDLLEADLICKSVYLPDNGGVRGTACVRELLDALESNLHFLPSASADLVTSAKQLEDPALLADFIAGNLLVKTPDKQTVLECFDPFARTEVLLLMLQQESAILAEEASIRRKVNARMNRNQQEYYLREQMKVIQEELGEGSDVEEFRHRILEAALPQEVEEKLLKEVDRLSKAPFGSAEATVIANYLDTCLDIPWKKTTKDRVNFTNVQKVLDNDHNGLEKVKERIVEYIAVKQLNPELRNQILCLVGPPGVGKTSIAASIAKAMNRKYVRISLGGVRDEADIRGHRKTYIGAMPGRIISALTQAGVKNPMILLDEIDKMSRDGHGDPTSAMLEVLDGEQNKAFRDHFVELPFDLSHCMFIATANSLENIPRPLLDRMEIIQLSIYTKREKLEIAKDHLIPKQLRRHGLSRRTLRITEAALTEIIDYYTREAGVRNLERAIASLCRKAGKKLLAEDCGRVVIDAADVESYLGVRKLLPETVDIDDQIGCVNGLAYTELGGSLLKVEVAVLEGSGKIETTGSLGDVMKESAQIAVSYVRSIAARYGIPTDFYKTKDIHIHFPEGATPKDGPSAGVTMVTALVSALTDTPVRSHVAMTGEVSLRGNVLPIGGLKEKTMAAYTAGATTVLIPEANLRDLEEIDPLAKENLTFIPCKRAEEVLNHALVPQPTATAESEKAVAASVYLPNSASQTTRIHFHSQG